MVNVAQLVRASDCGSEGRGFEPHLSPQNGEPKRLSFHFGVKEILNYAAKPLFASRHAEACLEANNKKLQIFHLKSGMKAKKSLTLRVV